MQATECVKAFFEPEWVTATIPAKSRPRTGIRARSGSVLAIVQNGGFQANQRQAQGACRE